MKPNVVRCANGHYYDSEKYSYCPHCGTGNMIDTQQSSDRKSKSKGSLFGNHSQNEYDDSDKTFVPVDSPITDTKSLQSDVTVIMEPTIGFINEEEDLDVFEPPKNRKENDQRESYLSREEYHEEAVESKSLEKERVEKKRSKKHAEVISRVPDTSGRTYGFFHSGVQSTEIDDEEREPIVGWLVCVKGNHLFESFSLYAGNNTIGRDIGNMIIISKDQSISRNRHAVITYEPRKRIFYLSSGDGSALTYLNNKMVNGMLKIKGYDLIEMGNSSFLFVPFCGKKFTWEDYLGS